MLCYAVSSSSWRRQHGGGYLLGCIESFFMDRPHAEGQQSTEAQQKTEEVEDHQRGNLRERERERAITINNIQ